MTTALKIQSIEEQIIESFLSSPKARLKNFKRAVGDFRYEEFTTSYPCENGPTISGHGQSRTRETALVKSICENYERQMMLRFFNEYPTARFDRNDVFHYQELRTSNGWAIHSSPEVALLKAKTEAIERHLLLYSFLKHGWQGFIKLNEIEVESVCYTSLLSRYTCNGYGVGLIIAKDPDCAGVTFGYFCDRTANITNSPKWLHALFEAKATLDGHKSVSIETKGCPIADGILHFLHADWAHPEFSQEFELTSLRDITPIAQEAIFKTETGIKLFGAVVRGGGFIPLFFPQTLSAEGKHFVEQTLRCHGIRLNTMSGCRSYEKTCSSSFRRGDHHRRPSRSSA